MRLLPETGNSYGEYSTATTHPFHRTAMTWNGLLQRPRLHAGFGKVLGVKMRRLRAMRPYAAAEGTPAAETSEVKATADGRIVQEIIDETTQTTMMAFRGWPSTTLDTQEE